MYLLKFLCEEKLAFKHPLVTCNTRWCAENATCRSSLHSSELRCGGRQFANQRTYSQVRSRPINVSPCVMTRSEMRYYVASRILSFLYRICSSPMSSLLCLDERALTKPPALSGCVICLERSRCNKFTWPECYLIFQFGRLGGNIIHGVDALGA